MKTRTPYWTSLSLSFAVFSLAAPSWAEAESKSYGLSNLLQSAPRVANTIRPVPEISVAELNTPARQAVEVRPAAKPVVVPATVAAVPEPQPEFNWRAIREEAFRNIAAKKAAKAEEKVLPVKPKVKDFSPQGRLLASIEQAAPAVPVARIEKAVSPVSDLSTFRVRALRAPAAVDFYPRHSRPSRLGDGVSHAQDYSSE